MTTTGERHWWGLILASILLGVFGCTTGPPDRSPVPFLGPAQRGAEWQQEESALKRDVRTAYDLYRQVSSMRTLQGYEKAVRRYLDHGLTLYRTYEQTGLEPPPALLVSLEQRTACLMDVADEYMKQGSLSVGVAIAAEVADNYPELPLAAPAQHRALAILFEHRYRLEQP